MTNIALLTSGGDAPGMNACIRAVVRSGICAGCEILGISGGFQGLIDGRFLTMDSRSVSNIIQRGGTILKTSRCDAFKTAEGLRCAAEQLIKHEVDVLIVIGGDGSFRGLLALSDLWDGKLIGIPGTIDNDLYGTDYTIGFDTAINTAVCAIDKIRDTADSHERIFLVEVMGRLSGYIALFVGIAAGAEEIAVPEEITVIREMCDQLRAGMNRGKRSSIIIVAEGDDGGGAFEIAEKMQKESGIPFRVVVLGHLQRGGSPSAYDRVLASRLGSYAVACGLEGKHMVMVGEAGGNLVCVPLQESVEKRKPLDSGLMKLHQQLTI
ncbi:MAG: 6-phosphofructokinase [Chlamydiales bacterium]|nr:6-phosphofructokinase [Chlamydiia bacterium]MCP5507391.1 6-phosphofructokinase [Chlamydiales bacterium]